MYGSSWPFKNPHVRTRSTPAAVMFCKRNEAPHPLQLQPSQIVLSELQLKVSAIWECEWSRSHRYANTDHHTWKN